MAREFQLYLADETQTERLGRLLAGIVIAPALIFLRGDLGAGKTTLSRGFIQARGHSGPVKSPTYTLIEPYQLAGGKIFHLDLYRLSDPGELDYLGLDDLLAEQAIVLVEWPERGSTYLPAPDLEISLAHRTQGREVVLRAHTSRADEWIGQLMSHFSSESHL